MRDGVRWAETIVHSNGIENFCSVWHAGRRTGRSESEPMMMETIGAGLAGGFRIGGVRESNADVMRGRALDSTCDMHPPMIVMWPIFRPGRPGPFP